VRCGTADPTGVARIDDSGNFHFSVFSEARARARSMVTGTSAAHDADGNLVPPPSPEPSQAQKWVQVAEQNDDIGDMLIFAGRSEDWFDIYKALELAQSSRVGGPGGNCMRYSAGPATSSNACGGRRICTVTLGARMRLPSR